MFIAGLMFRARTGYRKLVLAILSLVVAACGSEPEITGTVHDPFGNPLPEATISILNTTFEAKTDSDGEFEISYVPGNVELTFAKDGYATAELALSIEASAQYPVKDTTLYPVPEKTGIYYISENALVPLQQRTGLKRKPASKSGDFMAAMEPRYEYYYASYDKELSIPEGKAAFIDFYPRNVSLAKDHNWFSWGKWSMIGFVGWGDNGQPEVTKRIGTDRGSRITVRTFDLEKGNYTWFTKHEGKAADIRKPIFPFRVGEGNSIGTNTSPPKTTENQAPTQKQAEITQGAPAPVPTETLKIQKEVEQAVSKLDITQVQQELKRLGLYFGPIDGVAGRKTKKAIYTFEQASGFPATGTITPDLIPNLQQAKRENMPQVVAPRSSGQTVGQKIGKGIDDFLAQFKSDTYNKQQTDSHKYNSQ